MQRARCGAFVLAKPCLACSGLPGTRRGDVAVGAADRVVLRSLLVGVSYVFCRFSTNYVFCRFSTKERFWRAAGGVHAWEDTSAEHLWKKGFRRRLVIGAQDVEKIWAT